jgi:hypothetical protein
MKPISKINEQIYQLVKKADELINYQDNHDFNTRENMIVANIKVYSWIDDDDVKAICEKLNLSKKRTKKVLKEFDENRLISIHNHVCEMEVNYLKEQYEDEVDLTNYSKVFNTWHRTQSITKERCLEVFPKDTFYTNKYWNLCLKFKTFKAFEKYIIKTDGECYQQWLKRSKIDKFDCWQYGRSGGWFSICNVDELSFELYDLSSNFIYNILDAYKNDDNDSFNEAINYEDLSKRDLIKTLKDFIKTCEDKIDAIQSIIDDIEASTKYFKDVLVGELARDIEEFLSEYNDSNVTIRIENDKVKTSLGVSVPLEDFKFAFNLFSAEFETLKKKEKIDINKKVGNYFVQFATRKKDDVLIKAGCHKFSYNQIKTVISL